MRIVVFATGICLPHSARIGVNAVTIRGLIARDSANTGHRLRKVQIGKRVEVLGYASLNQKLIP